VSRLLLSFVMVSRAERRRGALPPALRCRTRRWATEDVRPARSIDGASSLAMGDGGAYRSTASPDSRIPGPVAICVSTSSRPAARRSMVRRGVEVELAPHFTPQHLAVVQEAEAEGSWPRKKSLIDASWVGADVNGQVVVPAGGHQKSPPLGMYSALRRA
jgi:hypothetical protein